MAEQGHSRGSGDAMSPFVGGWRLTLLGGFGFSRLDTPLKLPLGAQRVLAFLAIEHRDLIRAYVAQRVWMDSEESHAAANLRTALWIIKQVAPDVVQASRNRLALAPVVKVDLHRLDATGCDADDWLGWSDRAGALEDDLLPDWHDDWVFVARERFRQNRLRKLEDIARRLTSAGAYAAAVDVAGAVVAAEPLRETAQRVLIEAHLAEGNVSEAVRQFHIYAHAARTELGVAPSERLSKLLPEVAVRERV